MAHNSFFGVRTSGMYDGKKKKHSQRYKPFRNPQVALPLSHRFMLSLSRVIH